MYIIRWSGSSLHAARYAERGGDSRQDFIGRTFFDGEFQIRQDAWRGWVEKQAWALFSRMENNIQRNHVLVDM